MQRDQWAIRLFVVAVIIPLFLVLMPDFQVSVTQNFEELWVNSELSVRLKGYVAVLLAGAIAGLFTDLREYRPVWSTRGNNWRSDLLSDLAAVVLFQVIILSLILSVRVLLEDFENLVIEYMRYLDTLYAPVFFLGSSHQLLWRR